MNQRELRQCLIESFPRERTYLLPALHYVQHQFGYLPEFALQVVGWHLHIPATEVYGAATSYTELRIDPPAGHVVRVCTGLACVLMGAGDVMHSFRSGLGFEVDSRQSGPNADVTLIETACAFMCGVAPVAEIDGEYAGRLDSGAVKGLINFLQRQTP